MFSASLISVQIKISCWFIVYSALVLQADLFGTNLKHQLLFKSFVVALRFHIKYFYTLNNPKQPGERMALFLLFSIKNDRMNKR